MCRRFDSVSSHQLRQAQFCQGFCEVRPGLKIFAGRSIVRLARLICSREGHKTFSSDPDQCLLMAPSYKGSKVHGSNRLPRHRRKLSDRAVRAPLGLRFLAGLPGCESWDFPEVGSRQLRCRLTLPPKNNLRASAGCHRPTARRPIISNAQIYFGRNPGGFPRSGR